MSAKTNRRADHELWRAEWRTPIGPMRGSVREEGWMALEFPEQRDLHIPERPGGGVECTGFAPDQRGSNPRPTPTLQWHLDAMKDFLADLFAGRSPRRIPAIALEGRTEFESSIRNEMSSLGFGQTTTYGELARRAGRPQGARAVGQAMARNPLPLLIPCHRVLASGRGAQKLGGFSGGLDLKRWLLRLESGDGNEREPAGVEVVSKPKHGILLNI